MYHKCIYWSTILKYHKCIYWSIILESCKKLRIMFYLCGILESCVGFLS